MCLVATCTYTPGDIDAVSGNMVQAVTVSAAPFISLKGGEYEGLLQTVLQHMASILHFEYDIKEQKDGRYQGMIEDVEAGRADLAVGDITINPPRLLRVDFTQPIMTGATVVLVHSQAEANSIEDLVEQGYTFMVMGGGATDNMLRMSTDPTILKINQQKEPMSSMADAMDALVGDPTARMALVREQMHRNQFVCGLKVVGGPLNTVSHGFAVGKGKATKTASGRVVEVRTLLDYAISKLKTEGTLDRLMDKYWPEHCED